VYSIQAHSLERLLVNGLEDFSKPGSNFLGKNTKDNMRNLNCAKIVLGQRKGLQERKKKIGDPYICTMPVVSSY
jgi:hypothetical protein